MSYLHLEKIVQFKKSMAWDLRVGVGGRLRNETPDGDRIERKMFFRQLPPFT